MACRSAADLCGLLVRLPCWWGTCLETSMKSSRTGKIAVTRKPLIHPGESTMSPMVNHSSKTTTICSMVLLVLELTQCQDHEMEGLRESLGLKMRESNENRRKQASAKYSTIHVVQPSPMECQRSVEVGTLLLVSRIVSPTSTAVPLHRGGSLA